MSYGVVKEIEQAYLKKDVPSFCVGDTVDVATKIVEGEKERIQVFTGTVIMCRGEGINATFTVRRLVNNEGVERIFPVHSPFIASITVKRSGRTRRAKLFYLRDRVGKATRLGEVRTKKNTPEVPAAEAQAAASETK